MRRKRPSRMLGPVDDTALNIANGLRLSDRVFQRSAPAACYVSSQNATSKKRNLVGRIVGAVDDYKGSALLG
jgi:hypothetical protein